MRTSKLVLLLLISLLGSSLCAGQSGKVETIGAANDSTVSDAVKKVLDPKGYRILLEDGSVACEIWMRQDVPAQPKKDVPGAIYPQISESTLVGVISFPQATADYRGLAIKTGMYTMRYALLPNDGNHLGVAPNRDFLLLIPASSDSDPTASFTINQLVAMSQKVTGTQHPAPLNLAQPEGGTTPSVSKDDQEHWIFSAGIKLASGETLPVAIVVKGTAPQ